MKDPLASKTNKDWIENFTQAIRMREMLMIQIVFMAGIAADCDNAVNQGTDLEVSALDIINEIAKKLQPAVEVEQ